MRRRDCCISAIANRRNGARGGSDHMSSSDERRNSEHGLSPKDLSILNVAILLTQNRLTN